MTLAEVNQQFRYWERWPPVHEMVALLARCFTSWKPEGPPATEADLVRSQEARWAGGALNVKQLFEMHGGSNQRAAEIKLG